MPASKIDLGHSHLRAVVGRRRQDHGVLLAHIVGLQLPLRSGNNLTVLRDVDGKRLFVAAPLNLICARFQLRRAYERGLVQDQIALVLVARESAKRKHESKRHGENEEPAKLHFQNPFRKSCYRFKVVIRVEMQVPCGRMRLLQSFTQLYAMRKIPTKMPRNY